MKLRLYLSARQATFYQDFQTIAIIVRQAFGGSEAKNVAAPSTKEELQAAFGSMFGQ